MISKFKPVLLKRAHAFDFLILLKIIVNRINHYLAKKYLATYPQLAIMAFDHIGLQINVDGRYENDALTLIGDFISKECLNSDKKIALDVGANIGNHSIYFSKLFHQVIAFEPNPRTFALLKFNTEFACPANNITCRNYGLSNVDSRLMFSVDRANMGGASIVSNGLAGFNCESFLIDVKRLDGIGELSNKEIALIKIDVEGHELAVLQGSEFLIRANRPIILFEQSGIEINHGSSHAIDYLKNLGYRFATIEKSFFFGDRTVFKIVSSVLRSIFGFHLKVIQVEYFQKRHYGMIVALP